MSGWLERREPCGYRRGERRADHHGARGARSSEAGDYDGLGGDSYDCGRPLTAPCITGELPNRRFFSPWALGRGSSFPSRSGLPGIPRGAPRGAPRHADRPPPLFSSRPSRAPISARLQAASHNSPHHRTIGGEWEWPLLSMKRNSASAWAFPCRFPFRSLNVSNPSSSLSPNV